MSESILSGDTSPENTSAPVETTATVAEAPAEVAPKAAEASSKVETTESPAATNESWYSEDYKELVEAKGFKSIDDALKSYKNLEALVGNSVRIPSEDASDEAKKDFYDKIKDLDGVLVKGSEDFYTKLGRPETADKYELAENIDSELLANVPNLSAEIDDFKAIAHEAGLTNEQASKLVEMRLSTLEAQEKAHIEQRESAEAALRKAWGEDFDNRLAGAKQVAKIYSEKYGEAVDALINSPAGNNPALLNMMSELAVLYKEKKHTGMSGSNFGMTPDGARAKIAEKRADRGFLEAYNDDRHPGHQQAIMELHKLYAIANGQ